MEVEKTRYTVTKSMTPTWRLIITAEIEVTDPHFPEAEDNPELINFGVKELYKLLDRETLYTSRDKENYNNSVDEATVEYDKTCSNQELGDDSFKVQKILEKSGEGIFILGPADNCEAHDLPRVIRFNSDEPDEDKQFWKAHEKPVFSEDKKKMWCHKRISSASVVEDSMVTK